jgi:hypothetical protein
MVPVHSGPAAGTGSKAPQKGSEEMEPEEEMSMQNEERVLRRDRM